MSVSLVRNLIFHNQLICQGHCCRTINVNMFYLLLLHLQKRDEKKREEQEKNTSTKRQFIYPEIVEMPKLIVPHPDNTTKKKKKTSLIILICSFCRLIKYDDLKITSIFLQCFTSVSYINICDRIKIL